VTPRDNDDDQMACGVVVCVAESVALCVRDTLPRSSGVEERVNPNLIFCCISIAGSPKETLFDMNILQFISNEERSASVSIIEWID